jgi:multicomponent Na+:H+ antiporter subunit A
VKHRPSIIAQTGVRTVFHTLIVLSVYLLAAGHNAPGGGFAGGLVVGAALTLVWAVDGSERLRSVLPLPAFTLVGLGLLAAVTAGAVSWAQGDPFFQGVSSTLDLPVFGKVKLTSVLLFDTGVYLVVMGMVLGTLGHFSREEKA